MTAPEIELQEDASRVHLLETGIPVRAKRAVPEGQPVRWGSVDIAHLTRESLIAWLRSRPPISPDDPPFAETVLLVLLGHDRP